MQAIALRAFALLQVVASPFAAGGALYAALSGSAGPLVAAVLGGVSMAAIPAGFFLLFAELTQIRSDLASLRERADFRQW